MATLESGVEECQNGHLCAGEPEDPIEVQGPRTHCTM